jgi:hypothetical protein
MLNNYSLKIPINIPSRLIMRSARCSALNSITRQNEVPVPSVKSPEDHAIKSFFDLFLANAKEIVPSDK